MSGWIWSEVRTVAASEVRVSLVRARSITSKLSAPPTVLSCSSSTRAGVTYGA